MSNEASNDSWKPCETRTELFSEPVLQSLGRSNNNVGKGVVSMIRNSFVRMLGLFHIDLDRIKNKIEAAITAAMVASGCTLGFLHSVDVIASAITHVIGCAFAIGGAIIWVRRQIRKWKARHNPAYSLHHKSDRNGDGV